MEQVINFDANNYRLHGNKNKELIHKSLLKCGAGRSILLDKENNIIAGNGVYEQASELNIPVRIIETDGKELIAVKRTDLATDDVQRKELALFDNTTSDSSEFDIEAVLKDFDATELAEYGLDDVKLDNIAEIENGEDAVNDEPAYKLSPMLDETSQFYIIHATSEMDWLKLVTMMNVDEDKVILRNCYKVDGTIKDAVKRQAKVRVINAGDFFKKIKGLENEK